MKQNLIQTTDSNITYIPFMLPYLISQHFKELYQWNELCQSKDILANEEEFEDTKQTTVNNTHKHVIGLDKLLTQRDNINGRKGIFYNLMIVGKVGVGKSTIIKNIFNLTMEDKPTQYELLYNGNLQVKLNIHEMKSFGSQLNNLHNWVPFINKIEEYKRQFIIEEGKLFRSFPLLDNRIHACLFVVEPYQVSDMELKAMKELSEVVNVIPVVNKIDILDPTEVEYVKNDLQRMLNTFGIIPCKSISNPSFCRNQFPIMVDQANVTLLQRFVIDQHMMDLIEDTTQQINFERTKMMRDGLNCFEEEKDNAQSIESLSPEEDVKEEQDNNNTTMCCQNWWWKEPYLMEQMEVQNRYRSLLDDQKGKFQEWVNVLFQKQTNLSKEVDAELDKIELARSECQELEAKLLHLKLNGSPPHPGLHGNNSDKTLVVTNWASNDGDSIMDGGYINLTE